MQHTIIVCWKEKPSGLAGATRAMSVSLSGARNGSGTPPGRNRPADFFQKKMLQTISNQSPPDISMSLQEAFDAQRLRLVARIFAQQPEWAALASQALILANQSQPGGVLFSKEEAVSARLSCILDSPDFTGLVKKAHKRLGIQHTVHFCYQFIFSR